MLSDSLPVRLRQSDIRPLARPGHSEPDFVFFAKESPLPIFGSIELKRADSQILTTPRKQIVTLSRTASTALQQAMAYTRQMRPVITANEFVFVGSDAFVFVIMGMSTELGAKVTTAILEDQFRHLIPDNCKILPYDTLLRLFEQAILPRLVLLVPATIEVVEYTHGPSGGCGL